MRGELTFLTSNPQNLVVRIDSGPLGAEISWISAGAKSYLIDWIGPLPDDMPTAKIVILRDSIEIFETYRPNYGNNWNLPSFPVAEFDLQIDQFILKLNSARELVSFWFHHPVPLQIPPNTSYYVCLLAPRWFRDENVPLRSWAYLNVQGRVFKKENLKWEEIK